MFSNNTFVAAYGKARGIATELRDHLDHAGEGHTLDAMIEFEYGIRMALKELDTEMLSVIREESDRVMWKCLLRTCHGNLRNIKMNLRFWGEPEWDWEEVIEAFSFIAAAIENTTTMLGEEAVAPATAVPS